MEKAVQPSPHLLIMMLPDSDLISNPSSVSSKVVTGMVGASRCSCG
jgi:hypothetical protein